MPDTRRVDSGHGDRREGEAGGRGRGPGRPAARRASRAVAGDGDRAPREPRTAEPERREGRRPPGLERLDGQHHDGALVRPPRRQRPGLGQAARLAGAARDQLPARPARAPLPDGVARARRAAELPQSHEGSGPGGLLHRLGRPRCDRAAVGRHRRPDRARAARRPGVGSPDRADRRRRARRGRHLGGRRRSDVQPARRGAVGRRPEPPVARPGHPRHGLRPPARDVRGRRLAGHHRQVLPPPAGAVRAPGRPGAAAAHRLDEQRGVPAPAAARPGGAARAAAGAGQGTARAREAGGGARGRRAAHRRARPGRPRPRRPARRLPGRRRGLGPADGGLRLHDQGLVAADRGPPVEPLDAAHRRAGRGARPAARLRCRRPLGDVHPGNRRGRAVRRHGRPAAAPGAASAGAPAGARRPRPPPPGHRLHPAGPRPPVLGPGPRGAPARRADRHREPRRRLVDEPRWLDRQGRRVAPAGAGRLVRRRPRAAHSLARGHPRPARRARHRREQPGRPALRARRHLEPLRRAAPAGRDAVRPVRHPGPRAVVVRDLRRRPVDPGRHPVGHHAGARGRGAPVDRHPVDRDRAARLHGVRAGVRPGPRVDVPVRPVPARPAGRLVGLLPALDPAARPDPGGDPRRRRGPRAAPAAGRRRRLPAARPEPVRRARRDHRRRRRDRPRGGGRGRGAGRERARPSTSSASPAPT